MSAAPQALVLDDGELDDVVEMLRALGVDPERRRGGDVPETPALPERLFVATPRRAVAARAWPEQTAHGGPARIAVVDGDSNTLRAMLRRMGFHYLVRRPVHPYALRLLLLRALFSGRERRREARLPVGFRVELRAGLRRRSALLADLSGRGARLLSERPLPLGARIRLQLPGAVTGDRPLGLRAKVLRCGKRGPGEHAVALAFDGLSLEQRRRLAAAVRRSAEGPAALPEAEARAVDARRPGEPARPPEPGTPATEPGSEAAAKEAPAAGAAERRKHPRAAWEGAVEAAAGGAERVLVGRDLSVGGMRVDALELEPGARLRVALYPSARDEPLVLDARVVRSDEGSGAGLRFEAVPAEAAARLEALVAGLPSVEALEDGEAEAMGSVVSEILERG